MESLKDRVLNLVSAFDEDIVKLEAHISNAEAHPTHCHSVAKHKAKLSECKRSRELVAALVA